MTLLLNSVTAYTLLGIKKEKDKANHPFLLSKGNVSVMCQLLMRPNETISSSFSKASCKGPYSTYIVVDPVNRLIGN